jgi:hypothetical protein
LDGLAGGKLYFSKDGVHNQLGYVVSGGDCGIWQRNAIPVEC